MKEKEKGRRIIGNRTGDQKYHQYIRNSEEMVSDKLEQLNHKHF